MFRYKRPSSTTQTYMLAPCLSSLYMTCFSSLTLFEMGYLQKQLRVNRRDLAHWTSEHPSRALMHGSSSSLLSSSARMYTLHLCKCNRLLSATEELCLMLHYIWHSSRKWEERDSKGERSWKGGRKTKIITATSKGQQSARVSCVCEGKIILINNSFQSLVPYTADNSQSLGRLKKSSLAKSNILTLLKLSQTRARQMVIKTSKVSAFPPFPNDYFPPAFKSQPQSRVLCSADQKHGRWRPLPHILLSHRHQATDPGK